MVIRPAFYKYVKSGKLKQPFCSNPIEELFCRYMSGRIGIILTIIAIAMVRNIVSQCLRQLCAFSLMGYKAPHPISEREAVVTHINGTHDHCPICHGRPSSTRHASFTQPPRPSRIIAFIGDPTIAIILTNYWEKSH